MNKQKTIRSKGAFVIAILVFLVAGPGCEILNQVQVIAEPSPTTAVARVVTPGGTTATQPATTPGTPAKKTTPTEAIQPTPKVQPTPQGKSLKMNSPEYGAQAFLWWRPETADRDLGLMKAAGMTWVKQQFAWRDIEGAKKGAFNWGNADGAVNAANAKGIDILARIDNAPDWAAPGCYNSEKKQMGPAKNTQDWLDFLTAFVTRYKGRIRAYEIWNEPNLAREWCGRAPNATEYVALLKASYAKIKAVDPNAMIISGGMTPTTRNDAIAIPDAQFIEKMYSAMGTSSSGYFDVLGVHAAGYKAEPEADPAVVAKDPILTNKDPSSTDLKRIYAFRHVEDIRQIMVNHNDTTKQIVITEFGWTSDPVNLDYAWFRVDEKTKGNRIVRAYQYAKAHWSPWIGVMSLIYMANPDWNKNSEEYWWSITEPDGTPRDAYVQLKAMAK